MNHLDRNIGFLAVAAVLVSACAFYGKGIEGRVLDSSTGRPLAGVIVVARRLANSTAIVDSQTVCVNVQSATTDEDGRYRIRGWTKRPTLWPTTDVHRVLTAHMAGYKMSRIKNGNIYLNSSIETNEDRIAYLKKNIVSCHGNEKSRRNLVPFVRAIYNELLLLDETGKTNRLKEHLVFMLDSMEYGHEVAERRRIERNRGNR